MTQWPSFDQACDEQGKENIEGGLLYLSNFLNTSDRCQIIRIHIDSTPGTGHQSASLHLLRRLVAPVDSIYKGFSFTRTVEVYYMGDDSDRVITLLLDALPELQGQREGRLYENTAFIQLRDYRTNPPQVEVLFGFTGGLDETGDVTKELNVRNFLRLQPFGWQAPDQILRKGSQITIDLSKVPFLGKESFKQRAYFYPEPEIDADQWHYYLNNNDASLRRISEIIQWLTDDNQLGVVSLCPTYSIRNPPGTRQAVCPMGDPASDRIIQIVAGFRQMLDKQVQDIKPVFIFNFDDFIPEGEHSFEEITKILLGDPTNREIAAQNQQQGTTEQFEKLKAFLDDPQEVLAAYQIRRALFLKSLSVHLSFLNNPDLGQIQELVKTWGGQKAVVFVQIGRVPAPLYAYFMSKSQLPPIFEGQNNANLALTLGKTYLSVTNPNYQEGIIIRYPTTTQGLANFTRAALMCENTAKYIQKPLEGWKSAIVNPTVELGAFFLRDRFTDTIVKYFARLKTYYSDVNHDKFALALLYLGHCMRIKAPFQEDQRELFLLEDDNPLVPLFTELQAQIEQTGEVNLVPGALSQGEFADFYRRLLSPEGTLLIQKPVLEREPPDPAQDLQAVVLRGTVLIMQPWNSVSFRFAAPEGTLISAAEWTGGASWTPEGLPWIVLEKPFVRLNVADDTLPVTGSVGGMVSGTDLEIGMNLPLTDGQTVLRGTFVELKTIDAFLALAGGVDIIAELPAPLKALTGLGVRYVELAYNHEASNLEYISFRLETAQPWSFLWFELEHLAIEVAVIEPGDTTRRTIAATMTGRFPLGSGETPPTIEVNASLPDWNVWGQLGEVPLTANDLINLFHFDITPQWPQGHPPQITSFAFSYGIQRGNYEVSSRIDLEWPISIAGRELLRIVGIALSLSGREGSSAGGLTGFILILPDSAQIGLSLIAMYQSDQQGWFFQGKQTSGAISISDLLETYLDWDCPFQLEIDGLALTIETATNSFEFAGRVKGEWKPPIQDGFTLSGELRARIGYNGGSQTLGPDLVRVGSPRMPLLVAEDGSPVLLLPAGGNNKQVGWFGEVSLELIWNGIELTLFYNFDPAYQVFGITCVFTNGLGITGYIEEREIAGRKHQIATLQFTETTTLGSMVETMVSWLTGSKFALSSPWNALNSISLNRLALVYDFTANTVSFDVAVGPLELGIARIEAISLSYRTNAANPAENGVIITLKGSFLWQSDPRQPLSWDAARPETTPAPPGAGNKYLDLRLLALGQHVRIEGMEQATSVQWAIERMQTLPLPQPGELPPVMLDASSSWLIGAEFGVLRLEEDEEEGYLLTLQIVFNDPRLYGLRLKLAGKAAKILAGLDFQILYRQVSETVGVYQAEITLPTEMRRLSIGAYTVTLPVFGIAMYTNGDFQVDLGFPWNADFSRSFSIEAVIAPGIPLLGSAGLYFGKLSSATTSLVPVTTKGRFNPVLVFGFGVQMGFGKSLEYGVLKAGFSLTIIGILEGVLAKWNPYVPAPSTTRWLQVSDAQMEGEYYFWLRSALGISGKLYGSIDFAVIKADVTVQIILLVQITLESYEPLALTVQAAVDVSITLQLDLGLFKIHISLTFSLQIKETFTVLSSGTAPWSVAAPTRPGLLRAPQISRLRAWREMQKLPASQAVVPTWSNLLPPSSPAQLRAFLAPAFTVAGDTATSLNEQEACAVMLLFLESVPPVTRDTRGSQLKARGQLADTSFEILCKQVLRWVIAAMQDRRLSADEVDQLIVSDQQLLSWLTLFNDANFSLSLDIIDTFLRIQFRLLILASSTGDVDATFFPLVPALGLDIPNYGTWQGYRYSFADYNVVSTDFLVRLRNYFNELAVQVQREDNNQQATSALPRNAPLSVASFVFGDYFLLLGRQMLQAARSALRDFTYAILPGMTTGGIVDWVNRTGELRGAFTLTDLFIANQTHPLKPDRWLALEDTYQITTATESFTSISSALNSTFTPTDLALSNATHATLLRPGAQVSYPGKPAYTVRAGDDLLRVALHYEVRLADLISQASLLEQEDLLREPTSLFLPSLTYQALAADSLTRIAHLPVYSGDFSEALLAIQNAGRPILRPGRSVTYPGKDPYTVQAGDCLGDLANAFKVTLTELLQGTDLLRSPEALGPAAVLAIPPFSVRTRPGETLQSLARRLNTTIAVLAASPKNLTILDLFDATVRPTLDLPHLPQFRVKEVLEEIQRSLGLQHLSGMTSRYYLHGLRLPTAGITPRYRGMWVKEQGGTLTLPEQAGLYALSGQQFPLPTIQSQGQPFLFYLLRPVNQTWIIFAGANPDRLTLTIPADSPDNRRIQLLRAYARSYRLPVDVTELGGQAQLTRTPATYALTSALTWQAGASVTLPYGRPPDGVSALRLWQLPVALTDLPDPYHQRRVVRPRFRMRVARYDEASGATVNDDLASYGWASTIAFTVKQVPVPPGTSTSAALRTTCEIVGTSGSALVLLERLLSEIGEGEDLLAMLLLGYAPDQTGSASQGIQTDAPEVVTMGIAQVNLSTETRPTRAPATTTTMAGPTLLNTSTEFLRLLWEASITRAGGFYLYYYNAESQSGLPERIFNDKGEATLTLIVLYSRPPVLAEQNCLSAAMNALATAEPLETAQATIFAEADPMRPAPRIPAQASDTLAGLAFRYYGDVAELAEDNANVPLTTGAVLTITQGLYEVPPTNVEPGNSLARIAAHFGTTEQAIKNANPRQSLPAQLLLFQAIRLPRLQVTVGTSPGGQTLGQLAQFYGESLSTLAAYNQETPGLFAVGQPLTIAGGPVVNRPTVPAGVLALDTRRPVPSPVPVDPTNPDYARLSLLHLYTLLSFQVSNNAEFRDSSLSLPSGPTTEGAASLGGKIRIPRELAPGDLWTYRQALPYPQLVKQVYRTVQGLPAPAESPYRALGRLLQLDMAWQDLYGNRLITTLSNPIAGDRGPLNRRPYLTGYTDLLLGLNQWPSISASWQVLPAALPRLEVLLNFDDSSYQGLLSVSAPAATTLLASFTLPLDPASAIDLANYRLDTGTIQRARLSNDNATVELTVSPLPAQTICTLSVGNIKAQGQDRLISGQASCHYPDDPAQRTSTLQEQARRDLAVYTSLYYQLSDPNGIALTFQTSLLSDGRLPLTNLGAFLAWIGTIYAFLEDRAGGGKQTLLPQKEYRLGADIPPGRLNDQHIFALTLAVRITRTGGLVSGDLAAVSGLSEVTTEVAPLVQRQEEDSDTLGLTVFASRFEQALSVAGTYQLKVATGVDRFRLSPARSGSTLWAVRLSQGADTTGLSFTIANPGAPAIFVPRPVSNRLATQYHVPIFDYVTDQGIDFDRPRQYIDFVSIDLDLWVRQIFASLDGVLTPEFTAAIQLLDLRRRTTLMADLLKAKRDLAHLASAWMIPVYADRPVIDPGVIQQAFEQQLLQQLSNAYTTRAGLQFQARVRANEKLSPDQLLGTIAQQAAPNKSVPHDVTLTSPKLPLRTSSSNPLAFLLTAPEVLLDEQGHVMRNLPLNLRYEGNQVEHQIDKLPGIEGYLASSWLSFVLSATNASLTASLGEFPVPLVLRTYPESPTMIEQEGVFPRQPGDPLTQLTRWHYGFTYSLPFHYPQDTLTGMVHFNVPDRLFSGFETAFAALAEFITVFPAIQRDLREVLAAINADTSDESVLTTAAIAVASFRDIAEYVVESAQQTGGLAHPPLAPEAVPAQDSYAFHIQEGCIQRDGVDTLLVILEGRPPVGIDAPQVLIDPETYEVQPFTCAGEDCGGEAIQGDFCFWYRHRETGQPLSVVEGQRIQERQLVLTGLDLFAAQDAVSWILLQRNEGLAEPFVYTTGRVTFANPFHPTSDSGEQVINIATIGSGTPPHPITRSFAQHLGALFTALLQETTQPTLIVQAEIHYEYVLYPELSAVPLAILLQPPHLVNVADGGNDTLNQMIMTWEQAIQKWGTTHTPQKAGGTLWFDLTIMSELTDQSQPLLRLRRLCLPLSTLNPPLW